VSYRRLTQIERYQIHSLLQSKISIREMAAILKRDPSTISRELKRYQRPNNYDPDFSEKQSQVNRRKRHPELQKIRGRLEGKIVKLIREDLSPEQIISMFGNREKRKISFKAIYRYIERDREDGGSLFSHLRVLRKERKYTKPRWKPTRLEGRTMIEERPKKVEERSEIGDYERDCVLGKKGQPFLLSIVDRTTRLVKLQLIKKLCSTEIHGATVKALKSEVVRSITNDNGTEFSRHKETAEKLNAPIFFAHPHSPWQRGTNENTNGLIRQYFQKRKVNQPPLTWKKVRQIERRLNNRPRKCLGFKTPLQVHKQMSSVLR